MMPPIPIPPPILCTVMACDLPTGTAGAWIQAQWVGAVVLVLLAFLMLWVDIDFRHHDDE